MPDLTRGFFPEKEKRPGSENNIGNFLGLMPPEPNSRVKIEPRGARSGVDFFSHFGQTTLLSLKYPLTKNQPF
jgi:hypothetical protein